MAEHSGKRPRAIRHLGSILPVARQETGPALEGHARRRLETGLNEDFSRVRVHGGPASAAAAERIGARAFTLGTDVYLGAEAHHLSGAERNRLLVHEAVHTVQQGSSASLADSLPVSTPGGPAEREAHAVADEVTSGSPSLVLRKGIRQRERAVHRDITKAFKVKEGDFDVDLKTNSSPGGSSGMTGTIKFTANAKAPDSKLIKLLQVVRDIDVGTGKDYVWTGGEANRNKMMTKADAKAGVTEGFFVDHSAAAATPRKAKADAPVSPYYRTYWPNAGVSQDGSKTGKVVKEASLWDSPGSAGKRKFRFETAAKDTVGGHIYGTVSWGFDLTDPAKGKVENEYANVKDTQSATFDAAVKAFDEFYRNPGSSTAPAK